MALFNCSSVALPQSPFLSHPLITTTTTTTTTKSRTTTISTRSSSAINIHASLINNVSLIKLTSSSSFSSTKLQVVKCLKNRVAASPAPSQKLEEKEDHQINSSINNDIHFPSVAGVRPLQPQEEETTTITTTTNANAAAPLVPLVISDDDVLKRSDFPVDFMFGAGSSAQQTEGKEGRGANTWDYQIPDYFATDSLHKYKEDIAMLKMIGADAYRFSISWARIMKKGTGEINQKGIDFYNDLLNELLRNGIKPFVTLFHMDEPAALQELYYGFTSSKIVEHFAHYASVCFKNFGDKVQHWTTFNEPDIWSQLYQNHTEAPISNNTAYTVAHHIILAHARACQYYKDYINNNSTNPQRGEIGMTLSTMCLLPNSNSPKDVDSQNRAWDFMIGWFAEPLLNGDYPFIMKTMLGDKLPKFSASDKNRLIGEGSTDFIGVNYYSARYVKDFSEGTPAAGHVYSTADMQIELSDKKDGIGSSVNTYPQGICNVLTQMKQRYNNPKIYITENGFQTKRDDSIPIWKDLQDDERIEYIRNHLYYVRQALREGVNVNSYFVWSLLDSMEWENDYNLRMGLSYTDYKNDRARYPKKSAKWLHSLITQTDHNEGARGTSKTNPKGVNV